MRAYHGKQKIKEKRKILCSLCLFKRFFSINQYANSNQLQFHQKPLDLNGDTIRLQSNGSCGWCHAIFHQTISHSKRIKLYFIYDRDKTSAPFNRQPLVFARVADQHFLDARKKILVAAISWPNRVDGISNARKWDVCRYVRCASRHGYTHAHAGHALIVHIYIFHWIASTDMAMVDGPQSKA